MLEKAVFSGAIENRRENFSQPFWLPGKVIFVVVPHHQRTYILDDPLGRDMLGIVYPWLDRKMAKTM